MTLIDPPGEKIGLGPNRVPLSEGSGVTEWQIALVQNSINAKMLVYFLSLLTRLNVPVVIEE